MFFFSSRRRHTRSKRDWSSDVCSSDLVMRRIDEKIKPLLTSDIKIAVRRDQSIFIRKSIEDIQHHLILGSRSEERRVGKECRPRRCRAARERKSERMSGLR